MKAYGLSFFILSLSLVSCSNSNSGQKFNGKSLKISSQGSLDALRQANNKDQDLTEVWQMPIDQFWGKTLAFLKPVTIDDLDFDRESSLERFSPVVDDLAQQYGSIGELLESEGADLTQDDPSSVLSPEYTEMLHNVYYGSGDYEAMRNLVLEQDGSDNSTALIAVSPTAKGACGAAKVVSDDLNNLGSAGGFVGCVKYGAEAIGFEAAEAATEVVTGGAATSAVAAAQQVIGNKLGMTALQQCAYAVGGKMVTIGIKASVYGTCEYASALR